MTDEILEALYQSSLEDIVLVRKFPPGGARTLSYFGGLPQLPRTLDWPVSDHTGRPVTFLAQINLGSLPAFQSQSRLPKEGTLFFFVDSTLGRGWVEGARVLFAPQSCVDLPEREAPSDLPPVYGEVAYLHVDWLLWHNAGSIPAPYLFPYWPVEPMVIRTFAKASRRAAGNLSIDKIRAALREEESRVLSAAFGKSESRHELGKYFAYPDGTSRSGYPPPPGYPLKPFTIGEAWLPDEIWPYSWVFAAMLCAKLLDNRGSALAKSEQTVDSARAWRRAALEAGLFSPMSEDARAKFRAWIQSIPLLRPAVSGKEPDHLGSYHFKRWVAETITNGVEACLGYAGATKGLFPEYLLPLMRWRHHLYVNGSFKLRHQLFGAPRSIQSAADDYGATHVLLAQFDYDPGCLWYWGDVGALQFWITPQDLAELQFERVIMTADCH